MKDDILTILGKYRQIYMLYADHRNDPTRTDLRASNHAYDMYRLCIEHMRKLPSLPLDYT